MTLAARKTWPLKLSSSLNNAEQSFLYLIVEKLLETNIFLNIVEAVTKLGFKVRCGLF